MVAVGEGRRRGQRESRPAGEENGKCCSELGSGERRPDAEMDAGTERKMRTGWAHRVEAVRVGEARGVAVGGGEQAADGVAGAKSVAEYLDVGKREAGEEVERRVEAQHLLDGRRGRRRVGEEAGRVEPGAEDGGDAVADGVDRRLVACVQQKDAGGDQLIGVVPVASDPATT